MISHARAITRRNVRAFLWALRYGEGTQGDDGFRTLFGGKKFAGKDGVIGTFDDFADHPRIRVTMKLRKGGVLTSTAAGAGQFLERTWDGLVRNEGYDNFEPTTQELAMVALIDGRRALQDVIDGRIEDAVRKCNKEWASLPGSPYGQPVVTMAEFKREYEEAGGLYVNEDVLNVAPETAAVLPQATRLRATPPPLPEPKLPPVEDRTPVPVEIIRQKSSEPPIIIPTTQEPPMALPLIAQAIAPILIPKLVELVPQLVRIFGSGSAVSERNAQAVEMVANVAKEAIGAKNEQELLESIEDPEQAQMVKTAIERNFLQIVEAGGGGIQGAREFNIQLATLRDASGQAIPLLRQPAFVISIVLLAMVLFTVVLVLVPWEIWTDDNLQLYSDDARLIVVTAMITGVLSSVVAFWLGTSFQTQRQQQQQAALGGIGQRATDINNAVR